MKIECEVIGVSGNGETLNVKMQGSVKGAATWRPMGIVSAEIPETPKTQKAFHLGRRVTVTVQVR